MAAIVAMALSWLCFAVSAQAPDSVAAPPKTEVTVPTPKADAPKPSVATTTPKPATSTAPKAVAPKPAADSVAKTPKSSDQLVVSLLTCSPGPEIYELYGHEAIRVKGEGRDSVWNFGVFNFNEPNFVYRFVKGETDYMCVGYPTEWFIPEYAERGSRVVEQELNLSQEEARKLLTMLQTNALPENRVYRYNYVKDNCATRIWRMMEAASDKEVTYPDSIRYGTFRNEMRAYNQNYPWYQFGIDIALGSGIDVPITAKDEMYVPMEMERMIGGAKFADGRPVVKATRVLNEGVADATLPPTPWWFGPMFWCSLVAAILVCVCIYDLSRKGITRWIYSLWFFILGIAGCVVTFLVFVSKHEATSPNILILWLNPLQLIMAAAVWKQKKRTLPRELARYNIAVLLVVMGVWAWQGQSTNPALFPLMGATWIMSLVYAIIARKDSYNYYRSTGSYRSRLP